jgi:WD40 repeat protein
MEDCIPCIGSASGIVITDAAYSSEFDVFALSCNDSNCYLMSFGVESNQINLIDIIKGHDDEITQVCWSHYNSRWFTGSVDKTLRSWGISASPIDVLHLEDTVNCLIVNELNHLIVAGVGNQIRVYSGDLDSLVQICKGHTMEIKTLIYIQEEQQYISTSRDGTLRVWNAISTIQVDHKKKKHAI